MHTHAQVHFNWLRVPNMKLLAPIRHAVQRSEVFKKKKTRQDMATWSRQSGEGAR